MIIPRFGSYFPPQRVDAATKDKADWYTSCIDYIIETGIMFNDRTETETLLNILHGNIPNSFYKKTLNPYNSSKEKFTRFPATLRNYDIMSDVVRRYVSEYYKGEHEFIVGASSPEVFADRNAKLKEAIGVEAAKAFQQAFEQNLKQMQEQAAQNGDEQNINPNDAIPDEKQFMEKFNSDYVDKQSKQ